MERENPIEEAANLLDLCAAEAVVDDEYAEITLSVEEFARLKSALASLRKAAEGAEVLWLKNQTRYSTGGVTLFCDLKKPKDDGLGPMQRVLVLPIPEPGKEKR